MSHRRRPSCTTHLLAHNREIRTAEEFLANEDVGTMQMYSYDLNDECAGTAIPLDALKTASPPFALSPRKNPSKPFSPSFHP